MIEINNIHISNVSLLSYKQDIIPQDLYEDLKAYYFNILCSINVKKEEKIVEVILDVKITIKTKDGLRNFEIGQITTSNSYLVQNLDKLSDVNGEKLKINDELIIKLVSISLATTRGMLVIKSTGSGMKDIYLPIIDPKEFIDKNEFELVHGN